LGVRFVARIRRADGERLLDGSFFITPWPPVSVVTARRPANDNGSDGAA
jgi:hypothetical protein